MKPAILILTAAINLSVWAKQPPAAGMPTVTVCVNVGAGPATNYAARLLASDAFSSIGVGIKWVTRRCTEPDAIKVDFSYQTPESLCPQALAYAHPFGSTIVVFLDRLPQASKTTRPQRMLAWVLVHEICHILQAMIRHSESGIMKARWTDKDYFDFQSRGPGFTSEDLELIKSGIAARAARNAGKSSALLAVR